MVNPFYFQNLPKFYKIEGTMGHELRFRKWEDKVFVTSP
jgi:hypothetical protein